MRDKWRWVASPVPSDPAAPLPPFIFNSEREILARAGGRCSSLFGDPSTDKSAPEEGSSQGFPHAQEEARE